MAGAVHKVLLFGGRRLDYFRIEDGVLSEVPAGEWVIPSLFTADLGREAKWDRICADSEGVVVYASYKNLISHFPGLVTPFRVRATLVDVTAFTKLLLYGEFLKVEPAWRTFGDVCGCCARFPGFCGYLCGCLTDGCAGVVA